MAKLFSAIFWICFITGVNGALVGLIAVAGMSPNLPDLTVLEKYEPRLPLRVFSADGELLGVFGEEKRQIVTYEELPPLLVSALLVTEDQRFFAHYGLDIRGILRSALSWLEGSRQGASTITMQVARNFFLSREQNLERKAYEMLIALKIESRFSKKEIIEFYMNQIYLGRGSFGFAAAAKAYYGKTLEQLTIAEIAVLAGLPQAPSRLNPSRNPNLAKERQLHVLNRMLIENVISQEQHLEAASAPLPLLAEANIQRSPDADNADYVAEEARKFIYDRLGETAYELGLRVYTSINSVDQRAATRALRLGVIKYTLRHPGDYEGAEVFHDIAGLTDEKIAKLIAKERIIGGLEPAVILTANPKQVILVTKAGQRLEIEGEGLAYISRHLKNNSDSAPVGPGAQVRIIKWQPPSEPDKEPYWLILQVPRLEGGLVAMDPFDGKIKAMVGGFDFINNQYNHVTQAKRQIGSCIKPFIYSAALEKGFTLATIIEDAPFFLTSEQTGSGDSWSPQNFDNKYLGPLRLRIALAKSRNIPTIRVLNSIGTQYATDYIQRFGFDENTLPPFLSSALGTGEATPIQLAAGYSTFVNGGFLVNPSFITRIEDYDGNQISADFDPVERVKIIDSRNAYLVSSLLQSVVSSGTATRVKRELQRSDLGGKTGTTNDFRDAWFAGFHPELVAVSWVGFDTPKSMGRNETGGRAALPLWIYYMKQVLAGKDEAKILEPEGIVSHRINTVTGQLVAEDQKGLTEYFYAENVPEQEFDNFDSYFPATEIF